MTRNVAYLLRGGAVFIAGLCVIFAAHTTAYAEEDMDALNMTALELQQKIEECQESYAAAREEADAAAARVDEIRARAEELERQIPEQQQRSSQAVREQYKFQQQSAGIVDFLLSADSFYDFLSSMEYMERVSDANSNEIERLGQLKEEIEAEEQEIREAQRNAEAKAEDARSAMEEAQMAQAEVQRRIEEEARAQAEIAAQAAKLAEHPRDNDSGAPAVGGEGAVDKPTAAGGAPDGASDGTSDGASDGASGGETASSGADAGEAEGAAAAETADAGSDDAPAPEAPDDEELSDEDAYVAEWGERIDAYLSGSPLAGQGETFARAAYTYGVDPRFSPAISFTESSKGLYCFKSHNAWGWGSSSWKTWEEAIYAHVSGLASGYGGQISKAAAKKYCPPNWKTWYERTLSQMEMI